MPNCFFGGKKNICHFLHKLKCVILYQSHTDSLAVHWSYFDEESGIESFQLAIYEMQHGNKLKIFPMGKFERLLVCTV